MDRGARPESWGVYAHGALHGINKLKIGSELAISSNKDNNLVRQTFFLPGVSGIVIMMNIKTFYRTHVRDRFLFTGYFIRIRFPDN
eukprot:6194101-Pleurochrysis_carterae.AAC.3